MEIPSPPWTELPEDLTANIIGRLDVVDILESVQKVCTTWWKLCKYNPAVWRAITMKNVRGRRRRHRQLRNMFRRAADRSQGQLIELSLHKFGDNDLLNYVVDRSSKLRSLKLDKCSKMDVKCLTKAVQKLPNLEELLLTGMAMLKPEDVEIIGVCCPMLNSFTFNNPRSDDYDGNGESRDVFGHDGHALAIAKTMSKLRHLQFVGHRMKNEGLEAILDGCPHLESMYLWDCSELDVRAALKKRCSQQMKDQRDTISNWFVSENDFIEHFGSYDGNNISWWG